MFKGFVRLNAHGALLGLALLYLFCSPIAQASPRVAVVGSQDGRAEVFVADQTVQGGVFHRYQLAPGGLDKAWSDWKQIAPPPSGAASIAAARDGAGRLTVGWLSGGSIWLATAPSAGAALADPVKLDTSGLRSLALISNQDGRLEFLALSDLGAVWSIAQSTSGSWDQPNVHNLEGHDLKQIAATQFGDGRIALIALGGDGQAYWRAQLGPNMDWGGWEGLQGEDIRFVTASANEDGRLEVLAVGGDGNLWHRYITSDGSWSGWSYLADGPVSDAPVFLRNGDGRLEAFTRAPNRSAAHIWQISPNDGWLAALSSLPFGDATDDLSVDRLADGRLVAISANASTCTVAGLAQESPNGEFRSFQNLGRACSPPPPAVSVNWFHANPDHVSVGSNTTLEWSVGANQSCNPFNVTLLRKIYGQPDQPVSITGPTTTTTVVTDETTFRLTAACPGTNVSDYKEAYVSTYPPPPTPQAIVVLLTGPTLIPSDPKEGMAFQAQVLAQNVGNKASDKLTVKFLVDGVEQKEITLDALNPQAQKLITSDVPALTGFVHTLEWRIVENGQSLFGQITVSP